MIHAAREYDPRPTGDGARRGCLLRVGVALVTPLVLLLVARRR